jgi:hypothetical protein
MSEVVWRDERDQKYVIVKTSGRLQPYTVWKTAIKSGMPSSSRGDEIVAFTQNMQEAKKSITRSIRRVFL